MAYEVTATRRRPQRFDDLVGQEFVAETLKNSLKSGKIAHAYLFSGPRGCGKTSTARILAKALNCERAGGGDFSAGPCGECAHCQEITKGASLDVIEIDGASNTSVNDVRQIKDEVMFPPNSSRYKIYIIDEVHMLSTSAFNALLKTIEEPPPYVVFIFATTELQKVPATIKSRCQQFNFRLVAIERIKDLLSDACREIGIEADEEALFWIARESTGSVRDSYTLFDQVASFSDGHITYEKIRDTLGLVGVDRLNGIFELCAAGDVHKCMEMLDTLLQSGVSIEQFISDSADFIRSLLFIKNGITKEALLGNAPERYSASVLSAWNTIQMERALSLFLQLYRDVRYSLSPRYELELAFAKLCWLSQYVSSAEVKKAIDAAHALLGGTSASAGATASGGAFASGSASASGGTFASGGAGPASANLSASANVSSSASTSPSGNISLINAVRQQAALQNGSDTRPFSNGGDVPPLQSPKATANDNLSPKEIREAVMPQLSLVDKMAMSVLVQTGEWKLENDVIKTEVDSVYQQSLLEQKRGTIEKVLFQVCGKPMKLSAEVKSTHSQSDEKKIPLAVEVVRDTFKGTVE